MSLLDRYQPSPRSVATVFMIAVSLPAMILLPIVELQRPLWLGAILTFLIGDSVTTSLLGEYGLEESEGGYTRWACGAEPSVACSFGTRLLAFVALAGVYILTIRSGIGAQFEPIAIATLALPLVLAVGGFAATVLNSYAILCASE
jgi:hypothetical protein